MDHPLSGLQDITAHVDADFGVKVGTGGYGDIYKGHLKHGIKGHTGDVAVKLTRHGYANVPLKVLESFRKELDIWRKQDHPHVLSLLGFYTHRGVACSVSPWCDSGTILDYFKEARKGRKPELKAPIIECDFDELRLHCLEVEMLVQVADGLAYLHENNIAHGDIKSSNILVNNGVAYLSDFGFSVLLAEHSGSTSSHLGTNRWFAPESLQERAHRTRETDMWAFGCVILEIRTLQLPYSDILDQGVSLAISKDMKPYQRPDVKAVHPSLWVIAEGCWQTDSHTRKTSQDVLHGLGQLLESLRTLREAFAPLPTIRHIEFGYQRYTSSSPDPAPARLLFTQPGKSPKDIFISSAVQTVIEAVETSGECYAPDFLLPSIKAITAFDASLGQDFMNRLSSGPHMSVASLLGHTSAVTSVAFLEDGRLVTSSKDKTLHIWDSEGGHTVFGPLQGHTGSVTCVAVYRLRIASCSQDGTFRIWDANNGALVLGPIPAHGGHWLLGIVYSRNGTHMATAGADNRAVLWDANTGVQLREFVGHVATVMCVAFSEDGTLLVSGSQDNTVRIWDIAPGECIGQPMTGHTASVRAVCLSPDGTRVFSSSDDWTIRIWDSATRTPIFEPLRMDHRVLSMALSPDGKRLVSSSRVDKITLWDTETGASIRMQMFEDHEGGVSSVAFSPSGYIIASASHDHTIALWNVRIHLELYDTAKNVKKLLQKNESQVLTNDDLAALSSLVSSDYGRETLRNIHAEVGFADSRAIALRLLASLSLLADGGPSATHSPSLIDAAPIVITAIEALELRLPPLDLKPVARAFVPHEIAVADELMTKFSSPELGSLQGHASYVTSVAFLPDSPFLVSSSDDDTLRIWNIETGDTVLEMDSRRPVCCVAVSGSRIASCSDDSDFCVWDAHSGRCILGPITQYDDRLGPLGISTRALLVDDGIAYSRNGAHIATANSCAIWDANTGVQLRKMVGHTGSVMCVAFSEDGTRLVSGSRDETVRIWDVTSGELMGEALTGHTACVNSVCFSPDDKRIYTSSEDCTIRIWDAETRALIGEPLQTDDGLLCMALSPDGKRLVSGSRSGKITMWDAETGAAIPMPFGNNKAAVKGVAFSPDGRTIASGSYDGTISLWDVTDDWKRWDIEDSVAFSLRERLRERDTRKIASPWTEENVRSSSLSKLLALTDMMDEEFGTDDDCKIA